MSNDTVREGFCKRLCVYRISKCFLVLCNKRTSYIENGCLYMHCTRLNYTPRERERERADLYNVQISRIHSILLCHCCCFSMRPTTQYHFVDFSRVQASYIFVKERKCERRPCSKKGGKNWNEALPKTTHR